MTVQHIYSFLNFDYGRTVNARASCAGDREFEAQRPAKSYTALQTVHHRFNVYASAVMTRIWTL